MIHYIEKTNRDLTHFLNAIKHSDFSQSLSSTIHGSTFKDLNKSFNDVMVMFKKTRSEKEKKETRIYRNANKRLSSALTEKNYSYAAEIATSITLSKVPVSDVVALFVAGVKAYKSGKDEGWKPKPRQLATDGIRFAQERTGYTLSQSRSRLFSQIIARNIEKTIKRKEGRK